MNDELNKIKATFSILFGGVYSGICVEKKVSIKVACFRKPKFKLGPINTRNNDAIPCFLNFTKPKLNNLKILV